MELTVVELESFLDVRPTALRRWAERKGFTFVMNMESEGYFKVTITPDLSTAVKNALQTELDKVGRATIS
jgi:hypothetical protein